MVSNELLINITREGTTDKIRPQGRYAVPVAPVGDVDLPTYFMVRSSSTVRVRSLCMS